VPVVATRASSLPEVVHDGQTGLLVPVDQPAALAGALSRLLRDADLADSLGADGRRLVTTRFSQDRCLQRLLQLTCPEESS
jgi:glycosyltransferase involved in cell wall biosynthesis